MGSVPITLEPADPAVGAQRANVIGNLKVNTKILVIVVLLALVATMVGVISLSRLSAAAGSADSIYQNNLLVIERVDAVRTAVLQSRLDVAGHALTEGRAGKASADAAITASDKTLDTAIATYRDGSALSDKETALLATFTEQWSQYRAVRDQTLLPLSRNNNITGFNTQRAALHPPIVEKVYAALDELVELQHGQAASQAKQTQDDTAASRTTIIALLVVGLAIAIAFALYVSRLIVGPLRRVSDVLAALTAGNLTARVDYSSRDELGRIADDLNTALDSLSNDMGTIARNATNVAATSEHLAGAAGQMSAAAQETSAQAGLVSEASDQVSSNVQTVAAGSEEMGASIREIATNAAEAARLASQAVTVAQETTNSVGKLGDSSAQIGEVIKTITSIAEQTNLLALNATIEAARAGDAGKGFAVVANEVKELAQETAKATDDIARRVQAIQGDTSGAVEAIAQISTIIGQINDYQTTIASAVEEQSATTNEMNRNVNDAATGSSQITENISGVAEAANMTSQGVAEAQGSVNQLNAMAAELSTLVGKFQYQ